MTICKIASLILSPQAHDDSYSWYEDSLLLKPQIYNAANGHLMLDVMANDAGTGKKLYSIDDGKGGIFSVLDLLNADKLVNGISAWEKTASGNLARINNGKVEVDLTPELGAAGINALGADDVFTDTFIYAIKLANGTMSSAYVHITVYGQNDVATMTGTITGTVTEDANTTPSLTDSLIASGTVTVADVDMGENKVQAIAAGTAGNNGYGTFKVTANGVWTYTLDNGNAAVQALNVGQTLTDKITVTSLDGTASKILTITINGTNEAVVINNTPTVAGALSASAAEGTVAFSANLLAGASDADAGETATLSVANVTYSVNGGPSSPTAPTGVSRTGATLNVDPTNATFNHLAVGATTTIVVSYNVQDIHGASVPQTETITITGTNDGPVVAGALSASAAEGSAAFSANLLAGASDPDDGETATLSVASVTYSVNGGPASGTAPAGVSRTGATLNVDPANAAYNHLAVGDSTTIVVSYNVQDVHGASVPQTETITITGTNDGPTVSAALTASAAEGSAAFSANLLAGATDPDDGETATLSVGGVTYSVNGGPASGTAPAGVSRTGATLNVDPSNAAFNHLAVGDSTTILVSYNVQDVHGASVPQTETITITGTNDGPVVVTTLAAASVAEGSAPFAANLLTGASDADDSETATLSVANATYSVDGGPASATAPAGLSRTGATLNVDPTDPAFNHLAVGGSTSIVVSYNVQDVHGASVPQTETITINGTNDGPVVAAALSASAAEGSAPFSANLLAGASDADDGETGTLSVANVTYSVDGGLASVTAPAGVSRTGATLNVDPTDPAFNHLAVGSSTSIVVSYNVQDVHGASVPQTETITINGTNDGPAVSAALTASAAEGDAGFAVNLLTGASDADDGETATLSVSGVTYSVDGGLASVTAPAGVSRTGATLNVDPTDPAFNHLAIGGSTTILVSYNVQDVHGASVPQTETITITGTNDGPIVASSLAVSVAEGAAPFAANLLAGASDADDGETATLSVANVTYSVDSGPASGLAPAGFSLTGATLNVDPTNAVFDHLRVGDSTTVLVSYDIQDVHGASVPRTELVTINGTNDVAVIAGTATGAVTEDAFYTPSTTDSLVTSGTLTITDVDTGENELQPIAAGTSGDNGYGTFEVLANGAWTYTLDNTNPAVQALAAAGTLSDTITVTSEDGTDTQVITVTINGTDDPLYAPVVNVPLNFNLYWTDNGSGAFTVINRVSFQDADSSAATVRVTLSDNSTLDHFLASSGSGVTVSGNNTNIMTLDGTIADINAFLFNGSVGFDPDGSFALFTATIDDNGTVAGGNIASASINVTPFSLSTGVGGNSTNDLSFVNLTDIDTDPNLSAGTDVLTTSWSHQPLAAVAPVLYDGGTGTDTVTIVMTPDQLAAALSVAGDQTDLRDYFDGNPTGDTLLLSDSAWNADVTGFEVAHIALATDYGHFTPYLIDSFFDALPGEDSTPDADTADDLVIGTGGGDTLDGGAGAGGLNGDDVLVGLGGHDSLSGGSGSDLLLGGDGNDTLLGGLGADVLSGGRGADHFVVTDALSIDSIVDYSFAEGDHIDLSALLDTNFGPSSNLADFAQVQVSGSNVLVQVDADGAAGGASWTTVATLVNYDTAASNDPIALFFEGSNKTVIV